jgi:uncharacterized protein (UPF0335 family)
MFDDQNPPEAGHNSAQDLIKYIERVERLKSEIDELNDDLKSVKAEAKSAGYDMRTFNEMLKLRASAHRTSAKDCGSSDKAGWQTPTTTNINERSEESQEHRRLQRLSTGRTSLSPGNLSEQAAMYASWPTPTVRDHKDTGDLSNSMQRHNYEQRDGRHPRAWTRYRCGRTPNWRRRNRSEVAAI